MENTDTRTALLQNIEDARKAITDLLPLENWRLDSNKDGVKAYIRQNPATKLNMARGDAIISKSIADIQPAIQDPTIVLKWDDSTSVNEIVEKTDDYVIVRTIDKKKPLVTQRETVAVRKGITLDNGTFMSIGNSAEHTKFPVKKDYIRAEVLWSWILTPVENDPNKTNVIYIVAVDPKGWIPGPIFNAVIHEQAQMVKKLRTFIEKK